MSIEEIVETLLDFAREKESWLDYYEKNPNCEDAMQIKRNAKALRKAARILCELKPNKKKKHKKKRHGCKYCKDGEPIALDMCNDGIVIESDGKVHMLSGGVWEMEIEFCPKCGRKLNG